MVLRHRQALAGQCRLVHLQGNRGQQSPVGGNAVTGFHQHNVAGHELASVDGVQQTVATHSGAGDEHAAQCLQRSLGPVLLHESDNGVEDDHEQHDEWCLHFVGDHERHDRSSEQDQDQQVLELREQTPPCGDTGGSSQLVGAVLGEQSQHLCGGEACLGGIRMHGVPSDNLVSVAEGLSQPLLTEWLTVAGRKAVMTTTV